MLASLQTAPGPEVDLLAPFPPRAGQTPGAAEQNPGDPVGPPVAAENCLEQHRQHVWELHQQPWRQLDTLGQEKLKLERSHF